MHSLNNESRKRRRASTTINTDNDDVLISGATTGGPVPRQTTQISVSRIKFIVGLDYGTTYSSVSYIKFDAANPPNTLRGEQIKSVCGWPNTFNMWRNPDVPSESWYLDDEFYWGYKAREKIKGIEDGRLDSRNRIIQFAKLLLFEGEQDKNGPRSELRRTLSKLRKAEKDVIKDYIREILKHSKAQLERKEGFREDSEVELVFCVPAGWPAKAIRTMQEILLEVAQEIKFGILAPLFILNEPEAAAAYMLEALSGCGNLKVSPCSTQGVYMH
jgi:molecular chaperone DnaK (HSP70)